jgi:hypothetical protein
MSKKLRDAKRILLDNDVIKLLATPRSPLMSGDTCYPTSSPLEDCSIGLAFCG